VKASERERHTEDTADCKDKQTPVIQEIYSIHSDLIRDRPPEEGHHEH
jgi:hypothetical protein